MANDKKNLYKLVTQANKDNPDGVKSRFGYTVDGAYKGSVSVLESAYYDIKTVQVAGGSAVAPAGTFNPSSGLQASEQYSVMSNADGLAIKIEAGSKWTTQYQGLCLVRDYMSFYVSVKDETKYAHVPIGYQNVKTNDYYGQSLAGKYSFPSYEAGESKNNKYDRDDYIVGVGLDFDNFVIPYLKKFFNEDGGKWEVNTLRKIGGNLQMFAEILFPKTNLEEDKEGGYKATNYYVIHSPVTFDYHVPSMMGFFILHFPVPLFLVSDFSALGTVNVKKQQKLLKVGGGQIGAPFSSGKYKHKEAKIDGFKYSQYSKVGDTVLKQTKIDHIGSSRCFVRIFFDRAAQSELGLNSSLSEQQKKNLFTGAYDANQFIARRVIESGGFIGETQMQFYQFVSSKLPDKLDATSVARAFMGVAQFETGQNWALVGDIKDGQGFSCGGLQFTVKAGGVEKFCQVYKNLAQKKGIQLTADVQNTINHGLTTKRINNVTTFRKMLDGQFGKIAQLQTWWEEKGEITIQCYSLVCGQKGSALLFSAVLGGVNHLPYMYKDHLKASGACTQTDMAQKIILAETAHWTMWIDFANKSKDYSYSGGVVDAATLLANKGKNLLKISKGSGQLKRYRANVKAAMDKDFDMNRIPKRGDIPAGWK